MGELSFECSSLAESRDRHNQALLIARAINAPLEEARALEGIGNCHLREGHFDDAEAQLRQALAIYRRLNSPHARRIEAILRDRKQ
jgi:Tfp pilus assembly protein PilF